MKLIYNLFFIIICLFFNEIAIANSHQPINGQSTSCQHQAEASIDLFYKKTDQTLPTMLRKGLILNLNENAVQEVLKKDFLSLNIEIPTIDGEIMELELVQRHHLAKNFKVRGSISGEIPIHMGKYYEGKIKGRTKSLATVSFSENGEVRVLISTKNEGNMVIGKMNRTSKSNTPYIFYQERDLIDAPKFVCQTPDFDPSFQIMPSVPTSSEKSMMCMKPIDVYLECDYLMYQDFGGNIQSITNYVISIFHTSAALFRAEDVVVQTSEIFIWENEDPYTNNDAQQALIDFKDHLNGNFNGRVGHLLSTYRDNTGFAGLGGLAYINTMCSATFALGYNNLQLDFAGQILPADSYDVVLLTHEIGHNLGSKHTHACVWGPNEDAALDNCYETEGDCPPGPAPVNGGTIMSYCHVTPNGINLSEGFGQEPGDKIRTQIANASALCLSVGTANFQASIQPLSSTNLEEGGMVTLVGVPTSPDYYYQWYKNGELLTGIIFPTVNVSVAGSYTVAIVHNGCTETSAAVNVTVATFEASISCSPNCSACVGQPILLETNIANASYQWSTGATTRTIEVVNGGTYSVTVTNGSASSVATTTVNFTQQTQTDNVTMCEGEVHTVGNSVYDETGTYTDFITGNNGCLIQVTTHLTVNPTTEETRNITICQGESYTVHGSTYTQSGNYTNQTVNNNGCRHTIYTQLTVLPRPQIQVSASICEGGSYTVGTSVYTQAGTYQDILMAHNGCDSIVITTLRIADNYETNLNITICEGGVYWVGENMYSETGFFTTQFVAVDGCDSIVHLDLMVLPAIETSIERCSDENTAPGFYTINLISSQGCDSTVLLTVHPQTPNVYLEVDICTGQSYPYHGQILTETGIYEYVETDENGCPKTTFLTLNISNEIVTEESVMFCYETTYNGVVYTENATITTEGTSVNGCDSTHVLQIEVATEIMIEADFSEPNQGCDGDAGSVVLTVTGGSGAYTYLWSNGAVTPTIESLGFGVQSVTVTDANGCTASQTWTIEGTTQLAINYEATMVACRGEATGGIDVTIVAGMPPYNLFWSNGPIIEDNNGLFAGNYTFFITDANGCSLDTTITITEPATSLSTSISSTPTTNANDDGTATMIATGGISPYTYEWSNGQTTATIENLAAGNYSVTVTDANGCVATQNVEVEQVLGFETIANITDFTILPNPNQGLFTVNISLAQTENIIFEMYNIIGQRIEVFASTGKTLTQNMNLQDQPSGVYVLVVKSDTWRRVERVVLQ